MNIPTNKIHFVFDDSDIGTVMPMFGDTTDMLESPLFDRIRFIGRVEDI